MSARILDGEQVASRVRGEVASRVAALRRAGLSAGLATVLVGDDGPSARYVAMKRRLCEEVGIDSFHTQLPGDVAEQEVLRVIESLNERPEVNSILVQLPLPPHIDEERVLLSVDPNKDVDGLHPLNLAKLVMGFDGPLPCTPAGILELLVSYDIPIEGKRVTIIGRGLTIGRPLALLLSSKRPNCNAAVTVIHSKVERFAEACREADIIISAAGSPGLVKAEFVRPGATVVGAGTTFEGRRLISDLDDSAAEVAGWITPRIGGVGPMTLAMLLDNAATAAERDRVER